MAGQTGGRARPQERSCDPGSRRPRVTRSRIRRGDRGRHGIDQPATPDRVDLHPRPRDRGRRACRAGRQGDHVRLRRTFAEAQRGHDRDEDRYGRWWRDHRGDVGDGRVGRACSGHRAGARGGEHAVGFGAATQRRDHPVRRHDGRGAQHRRGRSAGARRRARLRRRGTRPRCHRRPRDVDGCDCEWPWQAACGDVHRRRQAGQCAHGCRRR